MFFNTKTLEGILAGFNKTVIDLDNFSSTARADSEKMHSEAEQLFIAAAEKTADAEKADRVRANILSMLEG